VRLNNHNHFTLQTCKSTIGLLKVVNHAHKMALKFTRSSYVIQNAELSTVFALPYTFGDKVTWLAFLTNLLPAVVIDSKSK
jgi:hypothetical protein